MSIFAVIIFILLLPTESVIDSAPNKLNSLQGVIYYYTGITLIAAFIVWKNIPESQLYSADVNQSVQRLKIVLKSPNVWLQAVIVVCAYCGFKAVDNYGLYAVQVLSMNQVDAAAFLSITSFFKPVGAIAARFFADRFSASKVVQWNFILLSVIYGLLSLSSSTTLLFNLSIITLMTSFLAVYALRGGVFCTFRRK